MRPSQLSLYFNLSEINWEHHTAGTIQARRLLKHLDDNFIYKY